MKFIYNGNEDYVSKQREAVEAIAMMIVDRINNAYHQHIYNWEKKFDYILQEDARYDWHTFLAKKLNKWVFDYINPYLDNLFVVVLPSAKFGYILLFGFKAYNDCTFWTDWSSEDRD